MTEPVGPDSERIVAPRHRPPVVTTRQHRVVGRPEQAPVRVAVHERALRQIEEHVGSDLDAELGGVLVGVLCEYGDERYVEVEAAVPATTTSRSAVHFTFTPESWLEVDNVIEKDCPDGYMVGWYHSHPSLGVFFSQQDDNVHRVVFGEDWHIAIVIDPVRHETGLFGWSQGRTTRFPGYYLVSDVASSAITQPRMRLAATVLGAPDPRALASFYERLLGWERVVDEPAWVMLRSPDDWAGLSFQHEPEFVRPVWPAVAGEQQATSHLDIAVEDLDAAVMWAIEAGAELADHQPQANVRVMLDPAGHPFCLFLSSFQFFSQPCHGRPRGVPASIAEEQGSSIRPHTDVTCR